MGSNALMSGLLQHKLGVANEFLVAAYLAGKGLDIFFPGGAQTRADLHYEQDGRVVRVQVKTSTWRSNRYRPQPNARLVNRPIGQNWNYEHCQVVKKKHSAHSPKNYTADEIEELWVVGTHLWKFPVEFITNKTEINLFSDNPTPRKSRRGYDPDKFIEVRGSLEHPFRNRLHVNI